LSSMRDRARAQFPMILLTLISIIQALALELLWSRVTDSAFLYEFSSAAFIGWGMASVALLGILQIWVMYSTLVIGFTWRPGLRDSIVPFVIGIQEFLLIELIDERFDPTWLFALASLFVVANWITHQSFRRARLDAGNAAFFRNRSPATLRDFRWQIAVVLLLLGFGIAGLLPGTPDWLALLAIAITNVVLLLQINFSRRLWANIMDIDD